LFQKINKRLRIEDLDEESEEDEDEQARKKRKESIDSNVDEELLKVCCWTKWNLLKDLQHVKYKIHHCY
jgi:hypothetical protein